MSVVRAARCLLVSAGLPGAKGPQHVGVGEKSITFIAQDGTVDDALHVAARSDLGGGDLDLVAVAIGVGNGGAVDDAIETGPESRAHAHGTGLAGGVECVAGKREFLEALGGEADGTDFSVGAGVEFAGDVVESPQQQGSRIGVKDGSAERPGICGAEGARGECCQP